MKRCFFEGSAPLGTTFLCEGLGMDFASAGANIISSAINATTQNKNTKRMIAAQREENEKAYQRNIEMWERENAYNSPSEVIKRLQAAGMNPNLAYGTPNVSAPSPDAPITDMSAMANMKSPLGAALEESVNARYMNALIQNMEADTKGKEADAAGKGINNKRDQINLEVEEALKDKRIQMYGFEVEHIAGELLIQDDKRNLLLAQAKYSQGLSAYLDASVDKINQDIAESKSRTLLNRIDSYTRNQYNKANIRNILSQANINERQYSELVATFLERHGIQIQSYEAAGKQLQLMEERLKQAITDNDWNAIEHLTGVLGEIAGTASDVVSTYGKLESLGLPSLDDYIENTETVKSGDRTYTTKTRHKVENSWAY